MIVWVFVTEQTAEGNDEKPSNEETPAAEDTTTEEPTAESEEPATEETLKEEEGTPEEETTEDETSSKDKKEELWTIHSVIIKTFLFIIIKKIRLAQCDSKSISYSF